MKKQVYHEGHNYVLEYDNNSLIMYKEDIDEWMGDLEYIKVFTVEGDTPRPMRVSDLLCMIKSVHVSPTKEHDDDDNFQQNFRRAA